MPIQRKDLDRMYKNYDRIKGLVVKLWTILPADLALDCKEIIMNMQCRTCSAENKCGIRPINRPASGCIWYGVGAPSAVISDVEIKHVLFKCDECGLEGHYSVMIDNGLFTVRHYPSCDRCGKREGMQPSDRVFCTLDCAQATDEYADETCSMCKHAYKPGTKLSWLMDKYEPKESVMEEKQELVGHMIRSGKYTNVTTGDLPDPECGNARHNYRVENSFKSGEPEIIEVIQFQHGAIKEHGVNGVMNEDLLAMIIDRLQGFQSSKFSCRENAIALTKLQEALMWLEHRTAGRESRGVEGKNEI